MSSEKEQDVRTNSSDSDVLLIQLHVAEYQALTTRATYFITLMSGVWPLVILFIALTGQVWRSFPRPILLWGSGIALQTMLIFWAQFLIEQYQIVRYVEAQLRPLIQPIVGDALFWQYEPWLAKKRNKGPISWEYSVALGVTLLMIVAIVISLPFSAWDYSGLTINLGFLCAVVLKTLTAIKTRRRFFVV